MSSSPGHATDVIALRMPSEVVVILKRRAFKQGKKVSEYLRARVLFDTLRSHKKRK